MNRRTFLKLTGVTVVLATTPLTFAEKKETPQWVRLAFDQPKKGQKVVMCDMGSDRTSKRCLFGKTSVWYGKIVETGIWGDNSVGYSMIEYEYYDLHYENKLIKRCFPGQDPRLCFFGNRTSYRYWMPVEGEFPKTLPPFPSRASHACQWIAFKDQMPEHMEEIDTRDQSGLIAKGWYLKHRTNDYFMPCEKDREWLNVNMVQVNPKHWYWRYV